jgi:phospholipase C
MPAQIKHLFVLMMENRSFDHLFGFMKAPGYDIEGLDPAALPFNEDSQGNKIYASLTSQPTGDLAADPNHHFADVTEQLYGAPNPSPGLVPDMSGFVRNYETKSGSAALGANIMKCFDPAGLPVLTTLARQYAVCDHWFSSIPGPTLPNRLYVHCGTSRGRLDMAPEFYSGFYTVYEELAKQGVSSCIYWSDWSETLTFSGLMAHQNLFYDEYANFAAICAGNPDNVPTYCFIEPQYTPANNPAGGNLPATDQHPDHDMRDGETLIQNVYNAIRQNDDLWHSSVLLIIYDEHGGIFDHVPPVPMVSPDNLSSIAPPFDFTLSGVRVPAVVISPYISPLKKICSTVLDHTSVIATALKLFMPPDAWPSDNLFARAKSANTFDEVLDLNIAPNDVWPNFPAPVYGGVVPQIHANIAAAAPLSGLQADALAHARALNSSLPSNFQIRAPRNLNRASVAGAFTQAVGKAAVAAHKQVKA